MSVVRRSAIDRRRFLEIGAAASLTAALTEMTGATRALASGGISARVSADGDLKPHTVIYDERFEVARRFGEQVRSHGVPARAIRGDVTQLWYAWLYPLWKRAPAPVAGLTAYAAMFCLERLAWDRRLRMVQWDAGGRDWPAEQAALIARGLGAGSLAASRRGAATDTLAASAGGPLHFWMIAPQGQLGPLTT